MSKVKAEPASSPPTFKTPSKPGEQTGPSYVMKRGISLKSFQLTKLQGVFPRPTKCRPDSRSFERSSPSGGASNCSVPRTSNQISGKLGYQEVVIQAIGHEIVGSFRDLGRPDR